MTRSFRAPRHTRLLATVAGAAILAAAPQLPGFSQTGLSVVSTAEAQARVSVGIFYDRLAPHGRWVRHRSHGYVWVPTSVEANWRPYTAGHWVNTDRYGWYWASEEPFAWATYHYGRWGYSRAYGWYWVPGDVWAPAWVTWRVGSDHVGWAPIAPVGSGYAWGAPDEYRPPVAESWVFVETRYVTATRLPQYIVPIREIPVILPQATQVIEIRFEQDIVINRPIEVTRISEISAEPMQTVELSFVEDPDQVATEGEQISVFQAPIQQGEPEQAPPDPAESPEQLADSPKLEEVLTDVPEEAGAPSAAQLEDEAPAEGDATGQQAEPEGEDQSAETPAEEGDETPADETPAEEQATGQEATEQEAGEEQGQAEEGEAEGEAAPAEEQADDEQTDAEAPEEQAEEAPSGEGEAAPEAEQAAEPEAEEQAEEPAATEAESPAAEEQAAEPQPAEEPQGQSEEAPAAESEAPEAEQPADGQEAPAASEAQPAAEAPAAEAPAAEAPPVQAPPAEPPAPDAPAADAPAGAPQEEQPAQ